MEIRLVEAELFRADRHDESNSRKKSGNLNSNFDTILQNEIWSKFFVSYSHVVTCLRLTDGRTDRDVSLGAP
jgi:hypothetical protein